MVTKKIKKATVSFLNLCIILIGQMFLFGLVVIAAILPIRCSRCKVKLVLDFGKGFYPGIKKCPCCGERTFEM
jgi:hypothetical protein